VELLKFGRHFRIGKTCKLIVGRNQPENEKLLRMVAGKHALFEPENVKGPVGAAVGEITPETKKISAEILAGYSFSGGAETAVRIKNAGGSEETVSAAPMDRGKMAVFRI